jgi:outer membrane protein OmpA-like peptidoglycan-associated protein
MLRALFAATAMTLIALPALAQPPVLIVFFPDWSGAIDNAATRVIGQAADLAKQNPSARITVTGYADNTGSSTANIYLTQLRAQRVIDGLIADGIAARRLKLVAAGGQTGAGVVSRRVEIAIQGQ